jgi:hypothetical protein
MKFLVGNDGKVKCEGGVRRREGGIKQKGDERGDEIGILECLNRCF